MDQLYEFTGPLRSMIIEKAPFKRLGPFWKEDRAVFFEKREYDSHSRLIVCEKKEFKELYAYLAGEGQPDFRRSAVYRFTTEGILNYREIWHYGENGTLRGKEIYKEENPVRLVEIEEDRKKRVLIEKEEDQIRGKQFDGAGRLISDYLYRDSEADLITRYTYTDRGIIQKKEESDKKGNLLKTTLYRCNESGLIKEEEEKNRKDEIIYHRVYEYPGGNDKNWLIREEYALNGRGKRIPLSLTYRSLNFYHEPRLVKDEEPPLPPQREPPKQTTKTEVKITRDHGTLAFSNGYYRGDLVEGKMEGKGSFSFNDGSFYRGEFLQGRPEGTGELTGSDGSLYHGSFKKGKMQGKGVMKWADGSQYKGPFNNGLMEGIGLYTWPNGDRFKGLFEKGRRTDQGMIERNS
jgi:hypothetical protein